MIVFYRLTEVPSTNPSPIYQDDKLALNRLCLKSFVEGYKDIKPYVVFILDYCTSNTIEMIKQVVPFECKIVETKIGINATCLLQYELALKDSEKDSVILFQECDYIHVPNIGIKVFDAIRRFNLISPYDHLNFYRDRSIHSRDCMIDLLGDTHWRTTERNTMTFGLTYQVLKDNINIFNRYGYLDNEVWKDLKMRGLPLWVTIPSFSTHMAKDWLAPSVDWISIWKNL